VRRLTSWLFGLYAAWSLLWVVHELWLPRWSIAVDTAFWTAAKLVVWIVPVLWLSRDRTFDLGHARGLSRGLAASAVWLAGGAILNPRAPHFDIGVANAIVAAPLLEEIVFRGFMFDELRALGVKLPATVALTAVAFLGLHLPGWVATGSLSLSGAANVLVFGLLCGALRTVSASLWSVVLLHFVNNAWHQGAIAWLVNKL
jgi:membrane protease YdiL (CAAX protease family)